MSAEEAAEKAAEALDRIALIAMEQGNIEKMKKYIGKVNSVSSDVIALTSDLLDALEAREYESAKTTTIDIRKAVEELNGLESRIFEGPKYQ